MRLKYDQETRDRVIRMFYERREAEPQEPARASLRHLSDLVGVPPDTIRGWVDRARVDSREKPGVTTAEREEIKALRKEIAELRRANEILKSARVDSSGRRNTSVMELSDGPVEEAVVRGSGWGAKAVGGGSGLTAADAVAGPARAVACGAA